MYATKTTRIAVEEMVGHLKDTIGIFYVFIDPKNGRQVGSFIVENLCRWRPARILFHFHPDQEEYKRTNEAGEELFIREIINIDLTDIDGYRKAVNELVEMVSPLFEEWGRPIDREMLDRMGANALIFAIQDMGNIAVQAL